MLIAALLSANRPPAQLVRTTIDGRIDIITSPALLSELQEVLGRGKFWRWVTLDEAAQYVELIRFHGTVFHDPPAQPGLTRDPDDDYLVNLADAARVYFLISGDSDLLDLLVTYPVVLSPRAPLDLIDD